MVSDTFGNYIALDAQLLQKGSDPFKKSGLTFLVSALGGVWV